MKVKAKSDYTPAPSGTHVARCVQIIDLGTQYSQYYGKSSEKVLLGWELPDEKKAYTKDGEEHEEPFLVWYRYTASLSKNANLRKHLEAWRGKAFTAEELKSFDLKNILDKGCLVSITHDEKDGTVYSNINSVMALPKGTVVPDRHHDLVYFTLEDFDTELFDSFSENLQNTIKSSEEYRAMHQEPEDTNTTQDTNGQPPSEQPEYDDDIPF